jgi:outer membrane protein W
MAFIANSKIKTLLLMTILLSASSQGFATDHDKWKVRLRGIAIAPDDSSTSVRLNQTTRVTIIKNKSDTMEIGSCLYDR